MEPFSVIVENKTGKLFHGHGYRLNETPPEEAIPTNCQLITIDNSFENSELLYALFIDDPDRIAIDYVHPSLGGITYDWEHGKFNLTKIDLSIDLDQVRNERNRLLSITDNFMNLPDLPESIKDELIQYRQQLRDITDKVGTEWKTVYDVEFPPPPASLSIV